MHRCQQLRSDSPFLAIDASPPYSLEYLITGTQPGNGTFSHLPCPQRPKSNVSKWGGVVPTPELPSFSVCGQSSFTDNCWPSPSCPAHSRPHPVSGLAPSASPSSRPLLQALSHRHQHILKMFPLYKSLFLAATRELLPKQHTHRAQRCLSLCRGGCWQKRNSTPEMRDLGFLLPWKSYGNRKTPSGPLPLSVEGHLRVPNQCNPDKPGRSPKGGGQSSPLQGPIVVEVGPPTPRSLFAFYLHRAAPPILPSLWAS